MPYGTVNADTLVTSTSGGILGAGNASIMKNRIINGAMVIDQRNAGASVTPTTLAYMVDRWQYFSTQASKFTAQQNAGAITPPIGFTNYLGMTVASAVTVGAGDTFGIRQHIEGYNIADLGWGTANAKTITISFQVYSSLTGTFGGVLQNSAQNRNYPFTFTISNANTWTQISITVAGDTSGTWLTDNGIGIRCSFNLGTGSTYSGTAGAWSSTLYFAPTGAVSVIGTAGATFYITGVQLEVGSSATGYEYRQYGQELALCQRYFEQSYTYGKVAGSSTDQEAVVCAASYATSTTVVDYGTTSYFKVTKRAAPTIAFYQQSGTANNWNYAALGAYTTVAQWAGTNGFGFYTTTASGATTNRAYMAFGHFTASAEL